MDEGNEIESTDQQGPSSIRRTMTFRNNTARQMAVNFLPSRQSTYTLRLRRTASEDHALLEEASASPDSEKQADIIVREMEQNQNLMEDSVVAEGLRKEALRLLPQGMTMKRNVRAKLSASVSLRSKRRPISVFKRFKYRISFAWKRTKERLRDFIFSIELWYEAIRTIEGNFGSAVASYFYFLRWLVVADMLIALGLVALVVIPQALYGGDGDRLVGWGVYEFFTGQGGYETSLLFYGFYHDGNVSSLAHLPYQMPFAYFFTMVCLCFTVFAVLCYRTAYSYRHNFIEAGGGVRQQFSNKVFCSWDWSVVSKQAADLTSASIYNELKELLNEQTKSHTKTAWHIKLCQYLTNAIIWCIVISGLVGLQFGLWKLLEMDTVTSHFQLQVAGLLVAVLTIVPILFTLIVRLEFYKPRTALYVTLARTWFLGIGTLIMLLYYWMKSGVSCWETKFGQEAYRLVLLDSFVSLLLIPLVEFVRSWLYKLHPSLTPEFNIDYNSLTLIYNQALLWFGVLFSPLLAVAVAIKFVLLFYVKRESTLRACRPARKIWRAAQTQTVFYMLVTLSLFTTMFVLGSTFFRQPSKECGPFRQYDYVYSVVSEGVLRLSERDTLSSVLAFLFRPGFIAFLGLGLVVLVYYMRAKSQAQHSMVLILRHMLTLQSKDKEFLLAAIGKVSNGEWLYSPRNKALDETANSHTWKYMNEVRKPSNAGFQLYGRPKSMVEPRDGDSDSEFSWRGSGLVHEEGGRNLI